MRKKLIIFIILTLLVLFILSLFDSLDHNYTDTPAESDLIVLVGGDSGRLKKTAELYKAGYADFVLITPVLEEHILEQSIEMSVKYGIPQEAIIADYKAVSTYTNATVTMDIMEENNMTSALIVTSDYHIKRTKYIYEKVNDENFEFKYIAALNEDGDRWHEGPGVFFIWYSEYIKLWWYRFGLYGLTG